MNTEMAYLVGMVLGNGEIQHGSHQTTLTIDIPHKNLYTDDMKDVRVYVKASITDIRNIVEPLIGRSLKVSQDERSTMLTFTLDSSEYVVSEIVRLVEHGSHHSSMRIHQDLFSASWANEFLPVGFNIAHKQEALEKYSDELLEYFDPIKTHKFYWEKTIRKKPRPYHPGENDPSLPVEIRGHHFDSWTEIAEILGYGA